MKNKQALASLALDLQRVAMGYHRGSNRMAGRFFEEAMKRRREIDLNTVKPYVSELLKKLDTLVSVQSPEQAEKILTYSILFQNAAVKS